MTPVEHFRRHADECRQAARVAPDRESQATWRRLAERWEYCTALQEQRSASARRREPPKHRPQPNTPIEAHA